MGKKPAPCQLLFPCFRPRSQKDIQRQEEICDEGKVEH